MVYDSTLYIVSVSSIFIRNSMMGQKKQWLAQFLKTTILHVLSQVACMFLYLIFLSLLKNIENVLFFQEEQEVVTKQLRKNMAYKANPVPTFYYEPPPQKPPLKKVWK